MRFGAFALPIVFRVDGIHELRAGLTDPSD
jgi:hypothetical protein